MGATREDHVLDVGRKFPLAYTKFIPSGEIKKCLLISSATSVPQEFYWKFAQFFAENGIVSYTFDYSGIGRSGSSIDGLKTHFGGVKGWGTIDQYKMTEHILSEYPRHKICLATHSIGGQILGFNTLNHTFEKVVMAASQSASQYAYEGLETLKVFLFFNVFIRVLTPIFGYYPGSKIKIFENLPGSMAREWQKWGRQKEYMMHYFDQNSYCFDHVNASIRSYSFSNDKLASKKGVDWLAKQYKNAIVERIHYEDEVNGQQPVHFGFFKEPFKNALWKPTLNWFLE